MSTRVHTNAKRRRAAAMRNLMEVGARVHDMEGKRSTSLAEDGILGSPQPDWARTSRILPGQTGNPYKGHATVFRCIRVIVGALIRPPLVAKEQSGGAARVPPEWRVRAINNPTVGTGMTGEPVTSGPWFDVLRKPNPHMTRRQFVEAHGTYLLTSGECGWLLVKGNRWCKPNEVPDRIWPLPRQALDPVLDTATNSVLDHWKVRSGTGYVKVPPEALIHHRYAFDPEEPLRGLGPLGAARAAMSSDMKAERYQEAFLDNAAEPGGILTTEGVLTKRQRSDMEDSWKQKHHGDKRGGVAVLEGGLTYTQLGLSQRDMEFLGMRQWNDTQIARVFGVPKFFLMEGTDISYASTRQNKRALWELAVMPIIDATEDVAEANLTATRSSTLWLEFDITRIEALKEDLDANGQIGERMQRMGYPLNEINERLDLGMKEQPWGNEGTLPLGVAPASAVMSGEDPYGSDPITDDPDDDDPNADPSDDPLPQEDKPKPARSRRRGNDKAEARADRSARWGLIERGIMRPGSSRMRKKVEGFFNGRRAEMLRYLRGIDRNVRAGSADAIELFLSEQRARWQSLIAQRTTPVFRSIIESAAKGVGRELGGLASFDMGDPRIASFMQRKVGLITGVSDTMADAIKETLTRGIANGEDVNVLQDRVRHLFRGARAKSLEIARTESAQATNGARNLVMKAEGVQSTEWLTSDDEVVRDETASKRLRPKANHRALDGLQVPIGTTFQPGIHLHHPGDVRAPSWWVVNCRCAAGAVR